MLNKGIFFVAICILISTHSVYSKGARGRNYLLNFDDVEASEPYQSLSSLSNIGRDDLRCDVYLFTPRPIVSESSVVKDRINIPSLEPNNVGKTFVDNYLRLEGKTSFDYGSFEFLDECYKIRHFINESEKEQIVFVYVASPGETLESQTAKTVIEALLKRGDTHILFVESKFPDLSEITPEDFKSLEIFPEALAVCLSQLTYNAEVDDREKSFYIHVGGLGVAVNLIATAVPLMLDELTYKPDRIIAWDPLEDINSIRSTNLMDLAGYLADIVLVYSSNMGQHGTTWPVPFSINVIVGNGVKQPGCEDDSGPKDPKKPFGKSAYCSHIYSLQLFAMAVVAEQQFLATMCYPEARVQPRDGLKVVTYGDSKARQTCYKSDHKIKIGNMKHIFKTAIGIGGNYLIEVDRKGNF